jgi:hypothetical protein
MKIDSFAYKNLWIAFIYLTLLDLETILKNYVFKTLENNKSDFEN